MKINNLLAIKAFNNIDNINKKNSEVSDFKKFFLEKIKNVDASQKQAEQMIQALAKGEDVDLSQVVLAISKADLDFKLLLKIRNKILDAYQEIMRMQI